MPLVVLLTSILNLYILPQNSLIHVYYELITMHASFVELKQGVNQVLVKLGSQGAALFIEGEETIRQPVIPASKVVDTTGAGDTFTAAFAVALLEGKPKSECLRFAGTVYRNLVLKWFFVLQITPFTICFSFVF